MTKVCSNAHLCVREGEERVLKGQNFATVMSEHFLNANLAELERMSYMSKLQYLRFVHPC